VPEDRAPGAAFFESVLAQSPVAIIVADRQGAIMAWNRAAEALFGYSAAEVTGRSLDVIIPEHLRAAHWAGFDNSLATGTTKYAGRVMTTRAVHKDGTKVYVDFSFELLRAADGSVMGAIAAGREKKVTLA
jgi:PAS domain S-box-containing protein